MKDDVSVEGEETGLEMSSHCLADQLVLFLYQRSHPILYLIASLLQVLDVLLSVLVRVGGPGLMSLV